MRIDSVLGRPFNESLQVTIVVPCYNELHGLLHLRDRLLCAANKLNGTYRVSVIIVDDASTDGSWKAMHDLFAGYANVKMLRHPTNRGVGAAILTGVRGANTEVVCSIDADCSYDPGELETLIPLLRPGVDVVTASPFHPDGFALGVVGWRLFLSRAASFLYRQVLRQKLHTYTSCFRVYRRSSVLELNLRYSGFLATAELIGRLDLGGRVIAECPTTLTTRLYGSSKMKTVRVLAGHLCLLGELSLLRVRQALFGGSPPILRSADLGGD